MPEKTPTAPEPITDTDATAPTTPAPTAKPISTKKLMLSLVSVKRITSDVPVCNEDRNELEIAGERASGDRWLRNSAGGEAWLATDSLVESGYFQFHAAVLAPRLNPKADETIPAFVLETENQTTAERPT